METETECRTAILFAVQFVVFRVLLAHCTQFAVT